MMRALLLFLSLCLAPVQGVANSFLPGDPEQILMAVETERPNFVPPKGVTGITVPHHLLAADLMARGFWAASATNYRRIILISPDHFRKVQGAFATSATLPETVLGPVKAMPVASVELTETPLFEMHPDIGAEHGVGALLPFVAHFFPDAEVLPVIASIFSTEEDWAAGVSALAPFITPDTLIIQSTDFSHFLPVGHATAHDQQVLAATASGELEMLASLHQPNHLDSRAAHVMQAALQRHLGSSHAVLANRNSTHYGGGLKEVTSYLTLAWHPDPSALSLLRYGDQSRILFAGDALLGRGVGPILAQPAQLSRVLNVMQAETLADPLVLNLEGVLVDGPIANVSDQAHAMDHKLALPTLRDLGVTAAGLANNHSWDLGQLAAEDSANTLRIAGVAPLEPNQLVDLGALRLVAVNMLPGRDPYQTEDSLRALLCGIEAVPPLVLYAHWGAEYTDRPTDAEARLSDIAGECGVAAVLGAHSHQASKAVSLSPNGTPFVFSLGNLLFDQNSQRASGALAELRVFKQGTLALRLIPVPNLFELGRGGVSE